MLPALTVWPKALYILGGAYDRLVSEDSEQLSDRERARLNGRDRKRRPPRVVVDNPGLKKLALYLAQKRRSASSSRRPR